MSNRKPNGYWTLERCMEDASKYRHRTEWNRANQSAYNAARQNGWKEQCCAHMNPASSDGIRKPYGYWTLERCIEDASQHKTKDEWRKASKNACLIASRNGWTDQCCGHMEGFKGSDNDVVYLWQDIDSGIHKIGVTSDRVGEQRIDMCKRHNDMEPRIVFMLKVDDARAVESELLKLGTDPKLDSSIDGYTEFRRLTDAQLGQAVSIAYEAAVAA